ncbi:MAG TPA: UrcA family protein [Allosphingosinicella sp.]|jgi:UrcA family protein
MKTLFVTALVAAGLAALPSPTWAQDQPRIAVGVADLDLSTPQGRAALDLRLLHAARTACGTPSPADPRGRANLDQCVAEARIAAAAQRDAAVAFAARRAARTLASR